MKIAEMMAKLDTLKANATAILDAVEADSRTAMDDDEQVKFDAIKAEIEDLNAGIAAAEKLADARREMQATVSRPALSISTRNEPNPATTDGFKSLAEFAVSVREAATGGNMDRRLMAAPTNVHQGTGSSGEGFLIPTEYRDAIWNAVAAEDDLMSRFNVEQTNSRSIEFIRDETTPWGASGVSAAWRAEGAQMTPSKLLTKAERMEIHDMYVLAAVTDEMLSDAPRLQGQLTLKAGQAIAYKAGEAFITGSGAGQPEGLMNAASLVTVAKETSQVAATVVVANISKMYSRLIATAGSPFWLANRDTFPQIQGLNTSSTLVFMMPGSGLVGAPNGSLLGYPIVYSEHAKTLGTVGDLVLINPAGYMAARKGGGVQFSTSIHLWFDYATSAFRWMTRMGGQSLLSAAISPANGSNTKSHFVALATRA